MVLVEAWSKGKPVIAAQSPAVSTLVSHREDGFVVEPTPETLRGAIIELLDSHELRATMGGAEPWPSATPWWS